MISQIYLTLSSRTQDSVRLPRRHRWEQDVGEIGSDDWELCLQSIPIISVSTSYRLSQLFILHRSHSTRVLLQRWHRRESPLCSKCKGANGDLIHLLWRCPKLFRYWKDVTDIIFSVYQTTIQLHPVTCLLGTVDEGLFTPNNIAVLGLLNIARKQIARLWLSSHAPMTKYHTLIKEKLTYQHRNAVIKFYKTWQPWLDTLGLAPSQLVLGRLLQI